MPQFGLGVLELHKWKVWKTLPTKHFMEKETERERERERES
jgi:hypothetical protein